MNIKDLLNEISAEIVRGSIPGKRVYDSEGQMVPMDKLKGSGSIDLLKKIKAALAKSKILNKFSPDNLSTIDISPRTKGETNIYTLTSDDGVKYTYNIDNNRITRN